MNPSAAARLCRAHPLAPGTAPDATSLADAVWLALQLAARGAAAGTPAQAAGNEAPDPLNALVDELANEANEADDGQGARRGREPPASGGHDAGDRSVPLYPAHLGHPTGTVAASFVRVPAGEALPQRLGLERALRPFKRRLPSRQQRELDPVATAEASADWRAITPVYRATPERWFDVAILAEATDAMQAWDSMLVELRRTLARHGAFRGARLWHYTVRDGALVLATHGNAVASPRLLVDPQGRRLCWFVTTGTSPMWRHAALAELADILGRHGPTVLVQLMPPHAWPHTLLGDASEEAVARAPGLPTARLHLRHPFTGEIERAPDAWTVPVTTLEPAAMRDWARFAMATRHMSHPAIRLPAAAGGMAPDVPAADVPAAHAPAAVPALPGQRIAAFRARASAPAFQLLRLLSGMPLSLPIMRLMQMGMADRAQVHLAEILLSGLVERVTPADAAIPADQVEYDFIPGVRAELLDSLSVGEGNRIDESLRLIADQARRYVEAHAGGAERDFAALAPDAAGRERLLQHARAFLRVGRDFRPLRDMAALAGTDTEGPPAAPGAPGEPEAPVASSAATGGPETQATEAADAFHSEQWIREYVMAFQRAAASGSGLRCLLIFATRTQRTWLVASDDLLHFVLDDEHTRLKGRLLQRTVSWFDALPVVAEARGADHGIVRFGRNEKRGWYYSPDLFRSKRDLETRILDLAAGGSHGPLNEFLLLAEKYEMIRADRPGPARTRAMQKIVEDMHGIALLPAAAVAWATLEDAPGMQLVAIVHLQRRFDAAHIDWLFEKVSHTHAFLAFQAALALYKAVVERQVDEPWRLHDKVAETKDRLLAARLDDYNIHRVLDDLAALCKPAPTPPAATADTATAGGHYRIFLCGAPGRQGGNRSHIAEILRRQGHQVQKDLDTGEPSFIEASSRQMEYCELVVLPVGQDIGYIPVDPRRNPLGVSLLDLQYDLAMSLGKPILVLMQESTWLQSTGSTAIVHLRRRLVDNHVVHFFTGVDALEQVLREALRGTKVERDAPPPLMSILVCGTASVQAELPDNIRRACRELGAGLATHGFGLLTGGWLGVDEITAGSFAGRLADMDVPVHHRLLQVVAEGTSPIFAAGSIARVPAGRTLARLAEAAQAVVAIGGRGGTMTTARVAANAGALLLPLGDTGGDAARLHAELRAGRIAPGPATERSTIMPGIATPPLSDAELKALGGHDGAAAALQILLRVRRERGTEPWDAAVPRPA